MPKFEKKPLPRGVKLYGTDVTQTQFDVAEQLSNKGIDAKNYKNPSIPWRMTLNPGVLRWETFTTPQHAIPFPFTLIPPQELFSSGGTQAYSDTILVLDEVSVSFDTRQEPAAIADGGKLHGALEAYDNIELVIVEKQQFYFNNTMASNTPERVIYKLPITSTSFAAMDFPLGQTGLGIQMSPYRTYAVQISAPNLISTANGTSINFVLPSAVISLKGKWTRLPNTQITTAPDDDNPELANGPNRASSDNLDTVTVSQPGGGTNIEATTLNTNLQALDNKLFEGIQGGYGPNSEMGAYGHTLDTMGYDIIAVPLFWNSATSGLRNVGQNGHEDATAYGPYLVPGLTPNNVYDRVVIPVAFPMEVHHVYCTWSTISPADITNDPPQWPTGTFPGTSTLRWQVGVSMGTGAKSDWVAMDNIAALEFGVDQADPSYWGNYVIDKYQVKDYPPIMTFPGSGTAGTDVVMLQVPLMSYAGGERGTGYYEQGKPVFVGRGNSWTSGRDLGAGIGTIDNARRSKLPEYTPANNPVWEAAANGFADTKGMENFIEVAVKIEDSAGIENGLGNEVLTGHGGFWVYMVVKRAGVENVERIR